LLLNVQINGGGESLNFRRLLNAEEYLIEQSYFKNQMTSTQKKEQLVLPFRATIMSIIFCALQR